MENASVCDDDMSRETLNNTADTMDDFIIYDEIGKSDRSIVYKGRKSGTLIYLALQRYDKAHDIAARAKYSNAYGLVHPNLVAVKQVWETDSGVWLAMEYCPGGNLADLLQADIKLQASSIKNLLLDLAAGLLYCHSQGIVVGGSVRPAKVLVDDGWIKLGGLDEAIIISGPTKNPPALNPAGCLYHAPEIITHGSTAITYRSDLWSLGCILFEMISGTPPFVSDDTNELQDMITASRINIAALESAPNDLVTLVLGLLEKDPADRYNWNDLADAQFLEGRLEQHDTTIAEMHFNEFMAKNKSILEDSLQTSLRQDTLSDPISPTIYSDSAGRRSREMSEEISSMPVMPEVDLGSFASMVVPNTQTMVKVQSKGEVIKSTPDVPPLPLSKVSLDNNDRSSSSKLSQENSEKSASPPRRRVRKWDRPDPPTELPKMDMSVTSTKDQSKTAWGATSVRAKDTTIVLPDVVTSPPGKQTSPSTQSALLKQGQNEDETKVEPRRDRLGTYDIPQDTVDDLVPSKSMLPRRVVQQSGTIAMDPSPTLKEKSLGDTYKVEQSVVQKPAMSRSEVPLGQAEKISEGRISKSPKVLRTDHTSKKQPKTSPKFERKVKKVPLKRGLPRRKGLAPPSARSPRRMGTVSPMMDGTVEHSSVIAGMLHNVGGVESLFHHHSDDIVTPIVGNSKIEKISFPKYKDKYGSLNTYSPSRWGTLEDDTLFAHLDELADIINAGCKTGRETASGSRSSSRAARSITPHSGAESQRMGYALSYLYAVCSSSEVANIIVNSEVFVALASCIRGKSIAETQRSRAASAIGLVLRQATLIDDEIDMASMMLALSESCREQYRHPQLKRRFIAALGETLFYVATQAASSVEGLPDNWRVPDQAYSLLHRILSDNDDTITTHYACKTIENVASISGFHAHNFATNDTGLRLWTIFAHASDSALRRSCAWGIARLCQLSPSVLQHITDKAGRLNVVSTLRDPSNRVKQPMVTALLVGFAASGLPRLVSGFIDLPEFVDNIMSIIERVPVVIRAKLYLLLASAMKLDAAGSLFVRATQLRLFVILGRDDRHDDEPLENLNQNPKSNVGVDSDQRYLMSCAAVLVKGVTETLPQLLSRLESVTMSISGRKRPSGTQAKEIRHLMTTLPAILTAILSPLVRVEMYSTQVLEMLASIIRNLGPIDLMQTDLSDALSSANEDLVRHVLCITESLVQHASYSDQNYETLMQSLLPAISSFMIDAKKETRLSCLKILLDAATSIGYHISRGQPRSRNVWQKLAETFCDETLFGALVEVLEDDDPIPAYAIRLLNNFVISCPGVVQSVIENGLAPRVVGRLQRQDSWVSPEAEPAPLLDSENIVNLVEKLLESPTLGVRDLHSYQVGAKIAQSLQAAFLSVNDGGRDLVSPLLQASCSILDRLLNFAPIDEAGDDNDELLVIAQEISLPFRAFLRSGLAFVGSLEDPSTTLLALNFGKKLLILFPSERKLLSESHVRSALDKILDSGNSEIHAAVRELMK